MFGKRRKIGRTEKTNSNESVTGVNRMVLNSFRCTTVMGRRFASSMRKVLAVYPPIEPLMAQKGTILKQAAMNDLNDKLDPTGEKKLLVDKRNPKRLRTGDIVRVVYDRKKCKFEDVFGYILSIDRKQHVQDASLLLRNKIAKTAFEVRVPIFSPLVKRIDLIQKTDGQRGRNKHYYIRDTRLDVAALDKKVKR